ncbi:hypothetical protein BCV69DRAFT_282399 [Microstroma glucosiphilum]|uniref:Uncharacterized protein n=1 Tax=Pseudomicrostroma glucosiphilum TaxID=1684307 RepID=A0A316U926_9BASI|nr:hypothetical protein BCV69DRAFT_282399 [Pseudomicrostroma glucosiphilum]PWN20883.1 hypothetical protein BCV69DRAFT_282399 [Pseudomicrostroma glucosiphilum]
MASGAASFMPASISSAMTRPHASTDSRLLQNLIKSEKTYQNHLASVVQSSGTAAAALKAWGTSEARDVAQTSSQLADLLHDVADAQNNYLEAIKGYREALKDVADREASIRTIVKDRDILVSRLIKASKKNGDVPHAQRELTACEEVLEEEERALIGVKRRTFKEALSMRMKLMGDAGNRMIECAKEAILLLDEFDQHAGDERMSTGQREAVDSYGQSYYATDYPGQGDHTQMDQQQQWGQEGVADDLYYQDQQYQGEQYQGEQYQGEQDMSRYHSHEVASVTPSQSASQTARGMGTTYGSTANNNGYTRPQFAGGAPPEVEERADSDASSVADPREESNQQAHYNRGGGYADRASAAHGQNAMPVPEQPVEAQHTDFYGDNSNQQPQSQMYSATAPSFNYDGPQMAPVPQAPRMYQRGVEASTDDGQVRGNAGWGSSRPSARNNDDGNSSDDGGGGRQTGGRGGPSRPKAQKRNSFFGKFKGLFKADLGDNEAKSPTKSRHSRNESYDRNSSVGGWNTRTDTNISSTRKSASKANGTYQAPHQNLMKPLNQGGDDSGSDDDDNRPDLVRVVNPNIAGKKASSDVGKTLRRTPSEISRITAGPKSVKQQREEEARKQADAERQAREAVMGAGIGSRPTVQRADTITSTASKPKKKKKATRSIAGSEIGTSATRQAPSASARPSSTVGSAVGTAGRPGPGSYVVSGDLSSGSRGLATLVLPSDIGKPDRPYPSIMPPTGLSRSNSTATAATGRASSIGGGTTATKKKKKRQSAVSDGMGTGLTAMSPTDSGKWTTNNWVQSPHGGSSNGIAGQAVAGAGLVPYTPASPEEIAQKYANNALTGSQIQRPGSAQSGAPLRSAMKGHNEHSAAASSSKQQQTATPASIAPKPLEAPPAVEVPPVQTQIEEANNNLGPSISAPPPVSAVIAESTQQAPAEESQEPPSASGDVQDEYEEEAPVRRSSPKLGEDKTFDGTGRLDLGRQGSPLPDSPEQSRAPLPAAQKPTVPHLDMPTSEPFKFDVPGMQQRPSQSGDEGDILTPGERSAYERLLGSDGMRTPSGAAPALSGLGMQSFGRPGGPKRPAPVPGSAPAAPVAVAPEPQRPAQQQPVSSSAQDEEPSTASTAYFPEDSLRPSLNPMAGRLSTDEPSRTYSNTSTVRGATTPVPQASRAAPAESASTKPAASTHLLPPSNNATSDVSATPSRRKSVRMAPDTKLPPDTPVMERDPGLVSDGFGGFTSAPAAQSAPPAPVMHTVTAPGSALAPSGNAPLAPTTAAELPPLSSKIAPPPSAPPRLPTKDNHASPPERERERSSGWTTRVDRRLGGNDDSSDEEGGRGAGGAGEDAYASARRAMGAASKRWKDTVSPSKKKSSGGEGGKSGSTKKSKVNSSGYNAAIPLPKGMEVVGRQKASE